VTTGSGTERAGAGAGHGRLRASRADREFAIDTLKVAFVQDRLTKGEFDARLGQALASRTQAELAAVTDDLPAGLAGKPRRQPSIWPASNAARWGASGVITPAIGTFAFALASLHASGGLVVGAFVAALVYFVVWLSSGADMLWQWHCMATPGAGMCVRCAHTAVSHRTATSCTVRPGAPKVWKYCTCEGYVPPGVSPESDGEYLLASSR
jgi:hypothetical protein